MIHTADNDQKIERLCFVDGLLIAAGVWLVIGIPSSIIYFLEFKWGIQ